MWNCWCEHNYSLPSYFALRMCDAYFWCTVTLVCVCVDALGVNWGSRAAVPTIVKCSDAVDVQVVVNFVQSDVPTFSLLFFFGGGGDPEGQTPRAPPDHQNVVITPSPKNMFKSSKFSSQTLQPSDLATAPPKILHPSPPCSVVCGSQRTEHVPLCTAKSPYCADSATYRTV